MLFAAVFLALIAAVAAEYNIYRRRAFGHLRYTATFSSSEVMVGDDVYLFEEIKTRGTCRYPISKPTQTFPKGLNSPSSRQTSPTAAAKYARCGRYVRYSCFTATRAYAAVGACVQKNAESTVSAAPS